MRVDPAITRTIFHPNPEVQEVLDIWAARFLHSGVPLGDLTGTVSRVNTWSDWGPEWKATARVHEEMGERALEEGRHISAVAAFINASKAYHLSYFLSVDDDEAHLDGLARMVETHDRALSYMEPKVEKITVPFSDGDLVGLLSVPGGGGPAPLVIFLPGLDSTKEQRHGGRGPLLRRGMAALSLDGPGQGEVSTRIPIRHDFEVAVAAAIDYLESDPRIDTTRVGLIGASLGGYYACRVAAFEPRVIAAVANCGPYKWIDCWDELPAVTRGAFRKYSWSTSDEEAREKAKALDLTGVAERISQPLVVVHGMLDPLIGVDHAQRIAAEAQDAILITVDDATHGVSNLSYKFEPMINDWIAEQLGGTVA